VAVSLDRAVQLYQLHKYSLAVKEIDNFLSENPENARAHALKAYACISMKKGKDALENAKKAVSFGPDDDYNHYALSNVYFNILGDYEKADASVREALRINPSDPDYYDVLAQLIMIKGDFMEALQTVDRGLKLDPQNEDCLSTRAKILARMGKKKEAVSAAGRALKKSPENPSSLASMGYVRLQTGDYQGALEAFRDALKINPEFEYARDGMAQALKAKHLFFRLFLNFSIWYSRLNSGWRWGMYVGIFLLIRAAIFLPFLYIIVIPYIAFAFSSWFVDPVFNLFLRFDKYGKYALAKSEKIANDIMIGCVALAVISAVSGYFLSYAWLYFAASALFMFSIPVTRTGMYFSRKPVFRKLLVFTIVIAAFLVLGLIAGPFDSTTGQVLLGITIFGELLFMFVSSMFFK
jgi:tetratricopeptide (TPR) repeat protein